MDTLATIINLFGDARGSLFYHLLTLLVLQVALVIALDHWRRGAGDPATRRLALAAAGILATRVLMIGLAFLTLPDMPAPQAFSPAAAAAPLERAANTVATLLLLWAVLTPRDRWGSADLLLGLTLGLTLVAAIVDVSSWHPQSLAGGHYNNSNGDAAWAWAQLLLLSGGLVFELGRVTLRRSGIPVQPGADWSTSSLIFALLATGNLLQLLLPALDPLNPMVVAGDIPGPVRVAQVLAWPLFTAYVWRHVLSQTRLITPGDRTAAAGTSEILSASRIIGSSLDEHRTIDQIAVALATALQADVAAVAVPSPDDAAEISLSAVYDRAAQAYLPARSFPLDEVTPLRSAIHRRRPLMLEPGHDDRALNRLLEHMSSAGTGLLLIQPMINGENALGAILVGNPRTNRPLTDRDRAVASALAERAALALTLARQHEGVAGRADQLGRMVREQDVTGGPLAQQLKDAQAEARRFAQRLTELQAELDRERENARNLAHVVATDGRASAAPAQPAGDLDDAMRALGERESEIARLLAAIAEQAEKMASLDKELADVSDVARTLAHELDDAQAQIARLKDPSEFQQLNDQLARTQLELVEARSVIDELARDQSRLLGAPRPGAPAESAAAQPDTEVLNAVVQELRTPMTSLLGYTDLLLDESVGILGAMQRKFLQRIKTNVERMRGIMDDLIRLTAIETGQLRLEPQPVDLTEVIAEAISRSSGQFREKGITLKVALAPGLPVIKADRDALYQVFVQLLHNAALCSRVDGEVLLEMRRETPPAGDQAAQAGDNGDAAGDHVLVALRDSGGGIAPEDRHRVFSRIYRADNPLIPGVGDTGVGLSIAKVLVEAQGGRIWVDSIIGSGSTFNVLLPLPGANGNGPKA